MKSKVIGITTVILSLLMVTAPTLAWTDMKMELHTNGITRMNEFAAVSGRDYTECGSRQITAVIHEGVFNKGSLYVNKEVKNPGEWKLQESKYMEGEGFTIIGKEVGWWTEDSRKTGCGNAMKYPTVANIFVGFHTDTLDDQEEIHNTANLPIEGTGDQAGEFSHGYFLKNYETNDDFSYVESVGINMPLDCTPERPYGWPMPSCDDC